MKTHPAWTLVLLVGLSACHGNEVIRGNGRLVEAERSAPAFSGVSISDNLEGEVEIRERALTLLCDDNLLDHVRTEVDADVLTIGADADVDLEPSPGAVVRIASPTIGALETSGASRLRATTNSANVTLAASGDSAITAETLAANLVSVAASGGSHVRVSGAGPRLVLDASGTSIIESEVPGDDVEVEASGASEVTVHASTRVRVRASGSSSVTIFGNPTERDVVASGQASVVYAD